MRTARRATNMLNFKWCGFKAKPRRAQLTNFRHEQVLEHVSGSCLGVSFTTFHQCNKPSTMAGLETYDDDYPSDEYMNV